MKKENKNNDVKVLKLSISSESDQKSLESEEDITGGVYGFRYGNKPKRPRKSKSVESKG